MGSEGSLNLLERAVLVEIAKQYPAAEAALNEQFAACRVLKRENTGAGFYTTLSIDRLQARAVVLPRAIGSVWADVAGCNQAMNFVLFTENGYCTMLEGAAIDDDTSTIAFDSAIFAIKDRY